MATRHDFVLRRIRELVNSEEFAEWVDSEVSAMNQQAGIMSARNIELAGAYRIEVRLVNETSEAASNG